MEHPTSIFELAMTVLAAVGGGGAVVVAMAAWLSKIWADRIAQSQKYTSEIDQDLRKRRIEVYIELWKATSLLPHWPRADNVTYEQLTKLSCSLRRWYYETGGIYLSRSSHDQGYGPLQEVIAKVANNKTGELSPGDYDAVRMRCSTLRSLLAADIESRRDSPI